MTTENTQVVISNKGTGAGGANTNKNGLSYEKYTDLKCKYKSCNFIKKYNIYEVQFEGYERTFIKAHKSTLHKYMKMIGQFNLSITPVAGCKEPDEAYINKEKNIVFIIEKKFQQRTGSVDEKIQTGYFKKMHYEELFPNFKIYYIEIRANLYSITIFHF